MSKKIPLYKRPRLIVSVTVIVTLAVLWFMVPKFSIGSGSMEPTLPVGTIVILQPADDLQLRDIITFQKEGDTQPTTHTFIGYAEDGSLMTRGDANPTPDVHFPPLLMDDVLGKVVYAIFPIRLAGFLILLFVGIFMIPSRLGDDEEEGEGEEESTSKHEVQQSPTPV